MCLWTETGRKLSSTCESKLLWSEIDEEHFQQEFVDTVQQFGLYMCRNGHSFAAPIECQICQPNDASMHTPPHQCPRTPSLGILSPTLPHSSDQLQIFHSLPGLTTTKFHSWLRQNIICTLLWFTCISLILVDNKTQSILKLGITSCVLPC